MFTFLNLIIYLFKRFRFTNLNSAMLFFVRIAIFCGFRPDGRFFLESGLNFGVKNGLTH